MKVAVRVATATYAWIVHAVLGAAALVRSPRIDHRSRMYCGTLSFLFANGPQAHAATCESLLSLSLPATTVKSATAVVPPMAIDSSSALSPIDITVPLCRVVVTISPTHDSDIKSEVWLPPAERWNGKFQGVGSSGLGGAIDYNAMLSGLLRGYAIAGTDTGHDNAGATGSFAVGHAEKVVDYGYRSIHLTALIGKAVTKSYYGLVPTFAYFLGCSQGGQEGLMEAQRFPTDYDGIIAGDPDYNQTHHEIGAHLWITSALFASKASAIPVDKAALIGSSVNAACDALDGVTDGVLEDPRDCKFDPQVLRCRVADTPDCLTAPQVEAVRKIWAGPRERAGADYYPGLERGGEVDAWNGWIVSTGPDTNIHALLGLPFFKYFVYENPNWDFHTFSFKTDSPFIDRKLGAVLNASNANLSPFMRRGGKLLHYHGFSDADVPPRSSIEYHERVIKALGGREQVDSFYRLFMVPGMAHCGGGPGANSFDMLAALQQWVEHDLPPANIVATKYIDDDPKNRVVRTHLLCPYPQIARYKGTGATVDASSFYCSAAKYIQPDSR